MWSGIRGRDVTRASSALLLCAQLKSMADGKREGGAVLCVPKLAVVLWFLRKTLSRILARMKNYRNRIGNEREEKASTQNLL